MLMRILRLRVSLNRRALSSFPSRIKFYHKKAEESSSLLFFKRMFGWGFFHSILKNVCLMKVKPG